MFRVLFVCMGNICRSPAAEGVFRKLVTEQGLEDQLSCDSAGTLSFHSGEPADSRMRKAAKLRGTTLDGVARPFQSDDFDLFDLIVTMDESNFSEIRSRAFSPEQADRVRRLTDWITIDHPGEIPDPYYGGIQGFDTVLNLVENGCGNLLSWIKDERGLDCNST